MDFHEAACIFPMLPDDKLDELAQDIAIHGQRVPIQVMDGKVLDGRNRWMACLKINKKPITVNVSPDDPIAFVLSLNLQRRDLDDGEKAMVGGRAKALYEKQAKERMKLSKGRGIKGVDNCPPVFDFDEARSGTLKSPEPSTGKARDKAGEAVGVSGKQIDRAVKVLNQGSAALIAACDAGEVAVSAAAKLALLPKSIQNDIIKQARDDGKDVGKVVAQAARHVVPQQDSDWTESESNRKKKCESGLAVVANKKTDQRLIRWAMETGRFIPIDRGTQWGNPFVMGEDGDREKVCDSFAVYYKLKPSLQSKVQSLKGKVLGCWCCPERCHGELICKEANK